MTCKILLSQDAVSEIDVRFIPVSGSTSVGELCMVKTICYHISPAESNVTLARKFNKRWSRANMCICMFLSETSSTFSIEKMAEIHYWTSILLGGWGGRGDV